MINLSVTKVISKNNDRKAEFLSKSFQKFVKKQESAGLLGKVCINAKDRTGKLKAVLTVHPLGGECKTRIDVTPRAAGMISTYFKDEGGLVGHLAQDLQKAVE